MFNSLLILFTYIVLAIPAAMLGLPWAMITRNADSLYRWSVWIVRAGLKVGRINVAVHGEEGIPSGRACIFMSNHISNVDPPVLISVLPFRSAFFLKRSLLRIPFLGRGMVLAGFIPVDRDGRIESARRSVDLAKTVLASGVNVCTFPEGTRSPNGRLLPFKKGPFYLAMESGATVIPISISGTKRMMPKGTLAIAPGKAIVTFHTPIDPRQFERREDLMEAVRGAIGAGLPEAMGG